MPEIPEKQTEEPQPTTQRAKSAQSVDELRKLAYTDELTGLMNRRFLRNRLLSYQNMAEKQESTISLAILDLDHFKGINDTYGHLAGDQYLKVFASIFRDTVGRAGIPIRYAGDEFVAIFLGQKKSETKKLLDELYVNLNDQPIKLGEDKVRIAVSVGIANYPGDARDHEALLLRADEALYYAKEAGKNRAVAYPDEGKLIAPGNISTLFPVDKTVGFTKLKDEIALLTINKITGEESIPELPVINGNRGSGKSRLLHDLREEALLKEQTVISVIGIPGNHKPYHALIKAFGATLNRDPVSFSDLAAELTPQEKNTLVNDIPELSSFIEDGEKTESEAAEDRDTLVFKAMNKLLFGLLRDKRVFITVDNAHWLDPVSLDFIDSFLSEFPESALEILFAINSDNPTEQESNMSYLIGNLSRISQVGTIESFDLPPLGVPDIAAMLNEVTGKFDFPREILDILSDRSGGNPLFIEELLKLIIERGYIQYDGTSWVFKEFSPDELPSSLDDILTERAERLPLEDKVILKKAAVVGESFDIRVLSRYCNIEEQEVLKTIERARRAHIISEVPGQENEFIFHSNTTLNVFYTMWNKVDLKDAHLDVAQLELELNEGHEDEIYGLLAHHYQKAGNWGKAAKVIAHSKERTAQARIPEATRRMLQRKAFEADMARESPLEKDDVVEAIKAFRNVKVAIQALRLYPRENENVDKAITRSFEGISSFFDRTEAITFSITQDTILVNGQIPGPETADSRLAGEFYQLINPFALQGIIFTNGLTKKELGDFLILFKSKAEDVVDRWEEILLENELIHVKPDRKVYVAMGQRKVILGTEQITVDTAKEGASAESEVSKRALEQIRLLVDDFKKDSDNLLNDLQDKQVQSPEIDKLISTLRELAGYIPDELRSEMAHEPVVQTSVEVPEEIVEEEVIQREERILPSLPPKPIKPKKKEKTAIELWIEDLGKPDKVARARAAQNIVKEGDAAASPCVDYMATDGDPTRRKLLAIIIRKIGHAGELTFAGTMNSALDALTVVRLLSVADVFSNSREIGEGVASRITNSDGRIREAVFRALAGFPHEIQTMAARNAMNSEQAIIKALGMTLIGAFGISELLKPILDETSKKALQKALPDTTIGFAAIKSLGYFRDNAAIDALKNIIVSGGLFSKKLPTELQIEAVHSLARIGTPESMIILKKAAKSGSKTVKEEATAQLERLNA